MELKTYFAQDAAGNIISSAIVNVFLHGTTTLATGLTRADGTPLENPFAADGAGRIQFRAPDGYYDVQVSAGPGIIQTLTIQCVDYSEAKAEADRAEAAADRADVSAEQAQNSLNSITGINTNFEQNSREQWRRSLAEAGLTLVSGSFEEGATANSATDAVWHISVGQCYTWDGAFPKVVPAGSTPASTGGVGLGSWVGAAHSNIEERLLGAGAKIYRGSNGQYVQNGDVIPVGTTHLSVLIGGNVFLVTAWDNLTLPATVTTVPTAGNGFSGYDLITDQGTFELVTKETLVQRGNNGIPTNKVSLNVAGWGAGGQSDDLPSILKAIEYAKTLSSWELNFNGGDTYTIDITKIPNGIDIRNSSRFDIIGNRAKIQTPVLTIDNSTPNFRMFYTEDCNRFTISGFDMVYKVDPNNPQVPTLNRDEQMIKVFGTSASLAYDFDIYDNTLTYEGPTLDINGAVNRFSMILISGDTSKPNLRTIKSYKIYNNTFNNAIGRVVYSLLAEDGEGYGNTLNNAGLINQGGARALGLVACFRALGCLNVKYHDNTINCYGGVLDDTSDYGPAVAFMTAEGVVGSRSEDCKFYSNTVYFNKHKGSVWLLGHARRCSSYRNNLFGSSDASVTTALISFTKESSRPTFCKFEDNECYSFKNLVRNLESVHVDGSNNFDGNEVTVHPSPDILFSQTPLLSVLKNYYSDKQAYCIGANRVREIIVDSTPPTSGEFSSGDICISSGYNPNTQPVAKWVYHYKDGSLGNVWNPVDFSSGRGPTDARPTFPVGKEHQYIGVTFTDATINKYIIWSGTTWRDTDNISV